MRGAAHEVQRRARHAARAFGEDDQRQALRQARGTIGNERLRLIIGDVAGGAHHAAEERVRPQLALDDAYRVRDVRDQDHDVEVARVIGEHQHGAARPQRSEIARFDAQDAQHLQHREQREERLPHEHARASLVRSPAAAQ